MFSRIALEGIQEAELICANTNIHALSNSVANTKVQLCKKLTQGLGCGGNLELGLEVAQALEDKLLSCCTGSIACNKEINCIVLVLVVWQTTFCSTF